MANDDKAQRSGSRGGKSGDTGRSEERGVLSAASKVADRAKQTIEAEIGDQVEKSANDLGKLAKTLRLASEQLEGNVAAPYVEKAATQIDRLAKYVESADARELLRRMESVGRETPLLYAGAALAVGFLGGRFLRSSAQTRSESGTTAKRQPSANESQAVPQSMRGGSQPIGRKTQRPGNGSSEQRA
jgi:hypothetical protein